MAITSRPGPRAMIMGTALLALGACDQLDLDLRNTGTGIDTTDAARNATAPRPAADARGVITYPNYQVAVARRGDTVATVASRIGLTADELARHNGIDSNVPLRDGEILALPRPVPAASGTGAIQPAGNVDISTLAGNAINRAEPEQITTTPLVQSGPEPVRHKVERGETAYSIARLYNVSVTSLAEWNGLGSDLSLREGQYLLIPVPDENARTAAAAPVRTPEPGQGSPTPTPPSASKPLPDEKIEPAKPLPSPDLSSDKTVQSQLAFPVKGDIIRGYKKGSNDGLDIAAAAGTPVIAAEAGTVAAITRDTDQVPILVIRHADNLLSVYANIDKIGVKKGDSVKRGQQVAVVRSGKPSFLHFEVRQGFESVDPLPFLN